MMFSLTDLCFGVIFKEFERFYLAFTESNNETLQRNLEFLQRKYSSELASVLFKTGELKGKYLKFLLNAHLRWLDLEWLEVSPNRKPIKDILRQLPNLEKIFCVKTDDNILKNVAKYCPKMVAIVASSSSVTDYGIKCLCRNKNGKIPCPDLKTLDIPSLKVTDEGVKLLIKSLPSLERIHYLHIPQILYSLHKADLHNLEKLPRYNLVVLEFFGVSDLPYYTDLLKICLTLCPRLNSIRLYVTDTEQLNLCSNVSLEDLDLNLTKVIPKITINDFLKAHGSKLVSLKISNCVMSVNVLATSCPKLKYLYMDDITFVGHFDSQTIFPCLTECVFRLIKNDVSTNTAMSLLLSSSPNLERLEFNWCFISLFAGNRLFECCENNNFLKSITFCFTTVEIDLLVCILLSLPSLKDLNLCDCDYSPDDLKELAEFAETLPNKPDISIDKVNNNNDYE